MFGWIDTTLKSLDDEKYIRRFSRRNKNSKWSKNTLSYGKKLIEDGLMSEFGLRFYEDGLKKGAFDEGRHDGNEIPKYLEKELKKEKIVWENFTNFAKSYKRIYIIWIESAKTKPTREKRIREVVRRAKLNIRKFS